MSEWWQGCVEYLHTGMTHVAIGYMEHCHLTIGLAVGVVDFGHDRTHINDPWPFVVGLDDVNYEDGYH